MLGGPQSPGADLALVQMSGRIRRALERFRKITGFTAVTSMASSFPAPGRALVLPPPIHPHCARTLRGTRKTPCQGQWKTHLRSGKRSPGLRVHTCPLGLRCACVPVRMGDQLVGVAKLVADPSTPSNDFAAATQVLDLVVSRACQDSLVGLLSADVSDLQRRLVDLLQARGRVVAEDPDCVEKDHGEDRAGHNQIATVDRALAYLQANYSDPNLTLRSVADAVGCNPKYLTSRFTRIVGERMHPHLLGLRVRHACRLLTRTDQLIKEVAHASGFSGQGGLTRAFRQIVGVSPAEYRRIFHRAGLPARRSPAGS